MRTILSTLAAAGILLQVSAASAAPPVGRVAILGPERSAIVPRLQRNFAENPALLATAVVSSCTRVIVSKELYALDAATAICTDGDVVSVWKMQDDNVALIDAVPITRGDDRSIEVLAARVTIAARTGHPSNESESMTIVANDSGGGPHHDAAAIMASANESAVDKPLASPQLPPERVAPRALFAAGPMLLASKPGANFAVSFAAELGVSRVVTFIPWFATMPVPRGIETPYGTATYRPTIFGLGFGVPLRSYKKTLVPRVGAGYALIWMHTMPGEAKNGTTVGESEDLWAPAMYANAALSVGLTDRVRIAAEGLLGTSTHKMIIRIARERTDQWGVPIASLGLRAEVVLP